MSAGAGSSDAIATVERPGSIAEAASVLREASAAGRSVRLRGGGTKAGWYPGTSDVVLETGGLDAIVEHNEGDFTAVLQAGVRLDTAQARFREAGQRLALDPWTGADGAATIGGVVACADAGPLRHRYGGVRDLVVGVTVVLSDGTVARAGGKVIKNVAGYDLGKVFAGSAGALGLIATVSVRLHPTPDGTTTARGVSDDPTVLARVAGRLAGLPLEADCLDVTWAEGRGAVLVRFGGATAGERAQATCRLMGELGLGDVSASNEDDGLWAAQRRAQREPDGVVVKVAGTISDLGVVLAAGRAAGGRVVGRAALGVSYIALPVSSDVGRLTAALPGLGVTVLDGVGTAGVRSADPPAAAAAVMDRIKSRFDPARVLPAGEWSAR